MNTCLSIESVAELAASPLALKVAFASQEGDIVDQHFGSAQAFYLYLVSVGHAELVAVQQFEYGKKDGNEDKLKPRLAWLRGADLLYCGSIGGSATRQLLSLGVTPRQVSEGPEIEELTTALQQQLEGEPEPWLQRLLRERQRQTNRFDAMESDDWQE
ncbi:NifB/NifX family molybdenum-iron cluster-binding protein [Parathalassolituus penaei]|uniref:NifB/NifX family molybdenum-iron cluster-binding protein n=1 Tax=Parathalassolituus penaei TaxID=2997323 RepID=A0A9X3EIC7_9GAMM|nr:NifB/NifX family molybdenum-iron cluster-binding protein [Parathalassolituus penaei]MCY0964816.1 NifB/NifX family molybdenum-iron cluster-binding protein [Parathalassolituus penaei]